MMGLTRELIQSGWIQKMILREGGDSLVRVLSEDELRESRRRCLAENSGADVWVFGYGSLLWNPCFHFAETRVAQAVGWHRRFCLWTHLGRGTAKRPGLMLGLERGGSCRGLAFRLPCPTVESELDIVWRREMVTAAYRPTWITLATACGRVRAIAFVINRQHPRYAGALDEARTIEALATAEGPLGTNREYLFNTVQHLAELGLGDRRLERLTQAVRAFAAAPLEQAIEG